MKPKEPTAIICLSPYHGGMEMDAIRTARLLKDITDITVILKKDSPSDLHYRKTLEQEGFTVQTIPFRTAFSLSIILRVRKLLRERQIKNIIFFGASEMRSLYFSLLGMDTNLIVRHGTTKSHKKTDPFHRLIYSRVNWHVAICKHIACNVKRIIPFGETTRLKVIYSSLRDWPFNYTPRTYKYNKRIEILHVGRITHGKGQYDAILACEIFAQKRIPFRLRLVGEIDEEYLVKLNKLLDNVSYRNSIELIGFTKDPQRYYQQSHIFLFPSKGEGLSNAFIEALISGLYCIAYSNTSFPELKELGFKFCLAEDNNLLNLKYCLSKSIEKLQGNSISQRNQMLARRLFNPQREQVQYTDILI